jgi:hypothetical protein
VPIGSVFSALNFLLLVSVSVFQLWFWVEGVKSVGQDGRPEYGFFFSKLMLNNKGFVAANIIFHLFLLFCCVGVLCISVAKGMGIIKELPHRRIRSVIPSLLL